MAISSSTSVAGAAQADGRCYVIETHTDSVGKVYTREIGPFVLANVDLSAIRTAYAALLDQQLGDAEFADRTTRVEALNLQYQTAAQFAARLRALYQILSRADLAALAWWMIEMINAGFVTDAQVRTAFGMTTNAYTTFKTTKVQPAHDAWASVLVAQGE